MRLIFVFIPLLLIGLAEVESQINFGGDSADINAPRVGLTSERQGGLIANTLGKARRSRPWTSKQSFKRQR